MLALHLLHNGLVDVTTLMVPDGSGPACRNHKFEHGELGGIIEQWGHRIADAIPIQHPPERNPHDAIGEEHPRLSTVEQGQQDRHVQGNIAKAARPPVEDQDRGHRQMHGKDEDALCNVSIPDPIPSPPSG